MRSTAWLSVVMFLRFCRHTGILLNTDTIIAISNDSIKKNHKRQNESKCLKFETFINYVIHYTCFISGTSCYGNTSFKKVYLPLTAQTPIVSNSTKQWVLLLAAAIFFHILVFSSWSILLRWTFFFLNLQFTLDWVL